MEILFQTPRSKKDLIGLAIVTMGRLASGEAKHCHVAVKIGERTYESLLFGGHSSRDYKSAWKALPHTSVEIPKRLMPLASESAAKEYLEALIGQFSGVYGIGKIPLIALDSCCSFVVRKRVFWFSNIFSVKSFPVCSALVGYIFYKFGATEEFRDAFINWRGCSPDDIFDILKKFIKI